MDTNALCPCGGNSVYSTPYYYVNPHSAPVRGVVECFACGARPIPGTQGAAAALGALADAEAAAHAAYLATYDAITAEGVRFAAFDDMAAHPVLGPTCAALDEARAALAPAALAYLTPGVLAALLAIHREGGAYRLDADMVAILRHLPDGALPHGWRVVRHGSDGVLLIHHGLTVVRADHDSAAVTSEAEERARRDAARDKARVHHNTYLAQLGKVREALAADPALRAAVAALYAYGGETARLYGPAVEAAGHGQGHPAMPGEEPARRAALALAYVGWGWVPGQEGGVLLPGGVPVGVRGALRIPREVSCG